MTDKYKIEKDIQIMGGGTPTPGMDTDEDFDLEAHLKEQGL